MQRKIEATFGRKRDEGLRHQTGLRTGTDRSDLMSGRCTFLFSCVRVLRWKKLTADDTCPLSARTETEPDGL